MSKTLEFIAQYASETESASKSFTEWLVDKLEAIRAEEREECAKVAHGFWLNWNDSSNMQCAGIIEQAIRDRGTK